MATRQKIVSKTDILENIFFLFLCAVVLVLPFDKKFSAFPLLLAALTRVVSFRYKEQLNRLIKNKTAWLFASFYLLFVVGAFYSSNTTGADFDLQMKLSIVFVPLVLATAPPLSKQKVMVLLKAFILACIVFALYAIVRAGYIFLIFSKNEFYYKNLISFSSMHPAYIGLFEVFSIALLTMYLVQNWHILTWIYKSMYAAIILFLILFILLLAAKTAIISCFIFLNIVFIYYLIKKYSTIKTIALALLANGIALCFLLLLPGTRDRFQMLFTYNTVQYANSTDSRAEIWKSAGDVLQKYWITGVGTGDVTDTLVEFYKKNNFETGVTERYNAHNQYLQIFIGTGIVGLLFFLFQLGFGIAISVKEMNGIYFCFLMLFILNICTESMLESQSGVVFFAFFNSVLGINRKYLTA